MHHFRVFRLCLILCSLLALTRAARAQTAFPDALPTVYAIQNARIEIGDGQVIEKGTVVVRDGLIESAGAGVTVPPDAQIVKGDGLTVYPGFIDAHVSQGLKLPDPQPNQDTPPDSTSIASPSMRAANRKGVRPELRAADTLALTDEILGPMREAGFTTALFAPGTGLLGGTDALVNLSGKPKRESIVVETAGLELGFKTSGDDYPGSLLGVFADLRQTFLDAQYYKAVQTAFTRGAGRRPPTDDTLVALQPALSDSLPVIFNANSENEILRSLKLADEFHLRPIISGGRDAWKQAALLARRRVPVLLRVDFGDEPGKTPAPATPANKATAKNSAPKSNPPGTALKPGEASKPGQESIEAKPPKDQGTEDDADMPIDDMKDLPPSVLADQKAKYQEKVACAAMLAKAGVPFAFSTTGLESPAKFLPAVRQAIAAGLSKDAAIEALSLSPARIFGVDRQLGTIAPGKIAALIVADGDLSAEKTKIKYLLIDTSKFEPGKDKPDAPDSSLDFGGHE